MLFQKIPMYMYAFLFLVFIFQCQNKSKNTNTPFTLNSMYKHPESRQVMMDIYAKTFEFWPAPANKRFVQGRFGKTYIVEWGNPQKDTLVLLHGLSCNVTTWGKECIEQLSEKFYLIAIETMGDNVGQSIPLQWPLKQDTLRIWFDELLDSMQLRSINLVGHAFGGWLALDYVIHHPQKVKSLSLVCAAGFCKPKVSFMIKMMYYTVRNRRKSMQKAYSLLHTPQFDIKEHDFEYFWAVNRHCKQLPYFPYRFESEKLKKVNVPVLIINGKDEQIFDINKAEHWSRKHVMNSQTYLIDHAGHWAHVDQPEKVSSVIKNFIR